jgi:hypothetical protein
LFDDLERALRGFGGSFRIPISIPLDDDGNIDRVCPSIACRHEFKVLFDDWEAKVRDDRAYCPLCRNAAEPTEFNTAELDEYVAQATRNFAVGHLNQRMHRAARTFNSSQPRNGFIKMSMSYHPGTMPILMPIQAAEQMRQKLVCEKCGCRYASIGAAFFCPACGHNSASSTFDQTIALVRKIIGSLDAVESVIIDNVDKDTAKDYVRETLENLIGRLISAFQRLAEALFDELPNRSQFNPRRNLFQNLSESSDIWQQAGKRRYDDILNQREHSDLVVFFQRRHVLEHREGIVDQAYIDNSGDRTYSAGQRLVILKADVERLAIKRSSRRGQTAFWQNAVS